jgi:HlyD family secretion protein
LPSTEVERLKNFNLVPGMLVEAFILSGRRTMMTYLVKPLSEQLVRAFRD